MLGAPRGPLGSGPSQPAVHLPINQVEKRVPERYAFGSRGPRRADTLINSMGFTRYTVTGVPGFAEDDRD